MPQIDEEKSNIVKLDKKDEKILNILKENSRETVSQIAKKAMISRESTTYRIKQLEKKGVIDKYTIELNYALLGYGKHHILFQLIDSSKNVKNFFDYLEDQKNVVNVIFYSDEWDIKAIFITKDTIELDEILTEINNRFSDILIDYEIMEEVKMYGDKPISTEKTNVLDEIDKKIINILTNNSRISFTDLSKQVSLSTDAIIYRMKHLKESGIIKKYSTTINVNKKGQHWYTMLFLMKIMTKKEEAKLIDFMQYENLIGAAKTIGEWNVVLSIVAKDPKEFHAIASRLRATFVNDMKDYDTLLAYKELKNTNLVL